MDLVAQAEAREEEVRHCFVSHDSDGSGHLDAGELLSVLVGLGLKQPGESDESFKELVGRCMKEHDANSDGVLSFNEFRRLYNAVKGVKLEDMREAASGSSLDARSLPSETFTKGPASRDPGTGGITTDINKDFKLGKTLGTAVHYHTKEKYAIKIINVAAAGEDEDEGMTLEEIAEEIRLTMSLKNTENAVKLYDFYVNDGHVYVVMELLRGGELLESLMEEGEYDEADTAMCMFQLFTGLKSIHERSITHRDLKLENLIFAEPNDLTSLRIADFGLAKKMKTARGKLVEQCGTPAYVAPEVITGQQYTQAVDMWASGVIMYAMLTGELPFDHNDQQSSFRLIAKGKYHPLPSHVSAEARSFLDSLLCVDKVKRLTAAEALENRWLRKKTGKGLAVGMSKKTIGVKSRMSRAAESKLGSDLKVRTLRSGELLIKKGERAKEVFLIKEGRCVVVVDVDGKEVQVAERGEGEFVGEMGVKLNAGEVADGEGAKDSSPDKSHKSAKSGRKGAGTDYTKTSDGLDTVEQHAEAAAPAKTPSTTSVVTLLRVKNAWVGGRRGADVRAATDMKVLVMSAAQMKWILEHDYGADGELTDEIRARKAQMQKSMSVRRP